MPENNQTKNLPIIVAVAILIGGIVVWYINNLKTTEPGLVQNTSIVNTRDVATLPQAKQNDSETTSNNKNKIKKIDYMDVALKSEAEVDGNKVKIIESRLSDEFVSSVSNNKFKPEKVGDKFLILILEGKGINNPDKLFNTAEYRLIDQSNIKYYENTNVSMSKYLAVYPDGYKNLNFPFMKLDKDEKGLYQMVFEVPSNFDISNSFLTYFSLTNRQEFKFKLI